MTDAKIRRIIQDVIARGYGTEALAVDATVMVICDDDDPATRAHVQRVWDKQFKVWEG